MIRQFAAIYPEDDKVTRMIRKFAATYPEDGKYDETVPGDLP
jgi:hypothetical protein